MAGTMNKYVPFVPSFDLRLIKNMHLQIVYSSKNPCRHALPYICIWYKATSHVYFNMELAMILSFADAFNSDK